MEEDKLLELFGEVNIHLGNLNPHCIKGWFDTDCAEMLKWISTTITKECYLAPQEEKEYSQLDNILTDNQLSAKTEIIKENYPGIFDVEYNLFEIEFLKNSIELLEEELQDCDHQIHINKKLNKSLLEELATVSSEEIKSQLEYETAYDQCLKLSQELDQINKQTYSQINRYSAFLCDFEREDSSAFINNININEFKKKFEDISCNLQSLSSMENEILETSSVKHTTKVLSELKQRIFQSLLSKEALEIEIEGLNYVQNFLNIYNPDISSTRDHDSVLLNINLANEQQSYQLSLTEELLQKLAERYINMPTLRCLKSEFDNLRLQLDSLNKFKEGLIKLLSCLVVMRNFYLQEKQDVNSSSQFFKNINIYIKKDLQESEMREKAMVKLINDYEEITADSIENKFPLISSFQIILSKGNKLAFSDLSDEVSALRSNVKHLRKQYCSTFVIDTSVLSNLLQNTRVLKEFLSYGPTSQITAIPPFLQKILFEVDRSILSQKAAVKQATQKTKDFISKDKWLIYKNQLWMYFMTDSQKFLQMLELLKKNGSQSFQIDL